MSEVGSGVPRSRRFAVMRWVLGLGIGVLATWIAVTVAGGMSGAWDAVRNLEWRWLIPAVIVEAASYVLIGTKLRRLIGPAEVTKFEAIELGLVVSGFGLLTPASPAEGLAIAASHLRRLGLPRRRVAFVFGFSEWFSTRVFLLLASLNLLVVFIVEREPFSDLWPLLVVAIVVLTLLAATARMALTPSAAQRISQLAGSLHRSARRPSIADRRAAGAAWHLEARGFIGPPRRRAALAALTAGALLTDAACLWFALLAAGGRVGFDVAFAAVSIGSLSVLIPLVPGGIGIVETALPAVTHHFGVPYEQGLAAAIAYRGLATFVPAGAGALAIIGLRTRHHHPQVDAQDPTDPADR